MRLFCFSVIDRRVILDDLPSLFISNIESMGQERIEIAHRRIIVLFSCLIKTTIVFSSQGLRFFAVRPPNQILSRRPAEMPTRLVFTTNRHQRYSYPITRT